MPAIMYLSKIFRYRVNVMSFSGKSGRDYFALRPPKRSFGFLKKFAGIHTNREKLRPAFSMLTLLYVNGLSSNVR